MFYYLIISTICIAVLYRLVKTAPEGYQDDEGFHFGKK